jgi:hypothetical protein
MVEGAICSAQRDQLIPQTQLRICTNLLRLKKNNGRIGRGSACNVRLPASSGLGFSNPRFGKFDDTTFIGFRSRWSIALYLLLGKSLLEIADCYETK